MVSFPNVIHPDASISGLATLGRGVVVTERCLVSVDVVIEDCAFLNCGAIIGHDVRIGAFTSIMPLAAISGNVRIGECCLIGVHSAIKQGVTIGAKCTIGMGSIIIRDVADGSTMLGNPAIRVS
jgi:sugar O-acyltransferase (sialic acid O-acetyltransferase NeuD family)